jgi:hypothetical protein
MDRILLAQVRVQAGFVVNFLVPFKARDLLISSVAVGFSG